MGTAPAILEQSIWGQARQLRGRMSDSMAKPAGDWSQGCGVGTQYDKVLVVKTGVRVGVGEAWP
jgi:hypothetical protein